MTGILYPVDLLRLYGQNPVEYRASDIMTSKVIDAAPKAPIKDAVATMVEHHVQSQRRPLKASDS